MKRFKKRFWGCYLWRPAIGFASPLYTTYVVNPPVLMVNDPVSMLSPLPLLTVYEKEPLVRNSGIDSPFGWTRMALYPDWFSAGSPPDRSK